MSVYVEAVVCCDGDDCDRAYGEGFGFSSSTSVRCAARMHGWVRRKRNGEQVDLCESCVANDQVDRGGAS